MQKKWNCNSEICSPAALCLAIGFVLSSSGCNNKVESPQESAFAALVKKAESKDVLAQVQLGENYLDGTGVEKDPAKAKTWFEAAATTGNATAQYQLGRMFAKGLGVPKDDVQAFALFEKSAAQSNSKGIHALAASYYLGDGTSKDTKKAIELWQKSAALGNVDSEFDIGYALEADGPLQDLKNAIGWYEKAIEHGDTKAIVNLGVLYRDGKGVTKDLQKAITLFQKGADLKDTRSQYLLGYMYHEGLGVPLDIAKSLELWKKSADGGDDTAQYETGRAYFDGNGIPKDAGKAAEWYLKSAVQGNTQAQHSIGWMYAHGEGLSKDMVLAYAWTNLASTSGGKDSKANRDLFEMLLTKDEKSEAQRLSTSWKKGVQLAREGTGGSQPPSNVTPGGTLTKRGTGTAFVVTKTGLAITNHHVVNGCTVVRFEGRDGTVKVKATDTVNDLALLEAPGATSVAANILGDPSKLRQGDDVVVFGFPLNTLLSSGGNLTPGVISALTGLGNNTNQIQITAPIQPGSSGSPVLNKKGEVVGVVSMKLSDAKIANATGSVGQNVNFAVGGQTLKSFLATQQVDYSTGTFRFIEKSTADLADEARKWTFVVECWK